MEGPEGVVEIRRAPSGPLPGQPPAGGPPPDNASLPEAFEVVGVGPGRARVRFALRRAWEEERAPLEEVELDVEVRA